MPSIWFGDLGETTIVVQDEIKGDKATKILDSLYQDWTKKHPDIFNDFRPVIINDNGAIECGDFVGFDDDEYSLTFILQGTSNHDISWGWQKYEMGANEVIRTFTNDLLKRLGDDSKLIFSFEVNADDGYESISIEISPNFENKFPDVESSTDFYSSVCSICGEEKEEDDEDICKDCEKQSDEKDEKNLEKEVGAIDNDRIDEALTKFPEDMKLAADSLGISYESFKEIVFKDTPYSIKEKWSPELKDSSDISNPDVVEKIKRIVEDCVEKGEKIPQWPRILSENGFDVEEWSIMTATVKVKLENGNFLIAFKYKVTDKADFIIDQFAGWYEE